MSTSLLYHTQGIHGFKFESFDFSGGETVATIHRHTNKFQCPCCSGSCVTPTFIQNRTIQSLPIGRHRFFVRVKMHRIRCRDCGAFLMERLPFVPSEKARYTKVLARTVIELRPEMSISAIAKYFGLHWTTVKEIEKKHLKKKYKHVPLSTVRVIGIDEIYVGKNRYLTVVRDLDSGAVLHIGEGKGADSLEEFALRIRRSACRIETVAVDLSAAYTSWINNNLSEATIVYDHFHVIKLMNDKLNKIRQRTMSELEEEQKKALKNKRFLLLKNIENLDEDQGNALDQLRENYKELGDASILKESLRNIYSIVPDRYMARVAFQDWCKLAIETGIPEMKTMAKTLTSHLDGIVAYWNEGITSAAMEGFNNKIGWLIRQAYGYHDQEYFKLKIFDLPKLRIVRHL